MVSRVEAKVKMRRGLNWHRSSYVFAFVAIIPCLMMVLPGQRADYQPTESTALYQHGWPLVYLERVVPADELVWKDVDDEQMKLLEEFLVDRSHSMDWLTPNQPKTNSPFWSQFANWNFLAGGHSKLTLGGRAVHVYELAANVVIVLTAFVLIGTLVESRRRRRSHVFQVSIAELLVLFCVVGVALMFYRNAVNQVRTEAEARAKILEGVACFVEQRDKMPAWLARILDNNRLGQVVVEYSGKSGGSMVLSNAPNVTSNRVPLGHRIVGISFENSMRFVRDNDEFAKHLNSMLSLETIGHWQGNRNSLEILKKINPEGIKRLDVYSFIDDHEFQFIRRFKNLESLTLRSLEPELIFPDQPIFERLNYIEIDGVPTNFDYGWLGLQPSLKTVCVWTSDSLSSELVREFKSRLPELMLQDRFGRSY